MLRKIVNIDEELCDGCELCVPECHEGALQIIDGKARLISDLFCDGLGACLGHCPQGAITIDVREAEPYNETKVMDYIVKGGPNVIKAHLEHLVDHNEMEYFQEAVEYLKINGISYAEPALSADRLFSASSKIINAIPKQSASGGRDDSQPKHSFCGCPGSKEMSFAVDEKIEDENSVKRKSHLTQWPIQFHLVSPYANYYQNSHILLTADCVPFSYPDYHKDFLKDKSLAVACPKLDSNQQVYKDKLLAMINKANLQSITVMVMQVPCCSGLYQLAQNAIQESGKNIPLKVVVIGINGEVLKEVQVN
ncbi:MAG: 4Fe-4S ferredoxin [Ignavibacteria bacterium]|nr:4Fe-4S ferredoxin [Ignavibacteria bacterium]